MIRSSNYELVLWYDPIAPWPGMESMRHTKAREDDDVMSDECAVSQSQKMAGRNVEHDLSPDAITAHTTHKDPVDCDGSSLLCRGKVRQLP